MIRPVLVIVTCLLLVPVSNTRARDDSARDDRGRFQGTWQVAALEVDGRKEAAASVKDFRMVYDDDVYELKQGREVVERGTFTLDPARKPKNLELKVGDGPDRGKTQLGIYQVDGDTLKICIAGAGSQRRPTAFSTTPGSGFQFLLLKRSKP